MPVVSKQEQSCRANAEQGYIFRVHRYIVVGRGFGSSTGRVRNLRGGTGGGTFDIASFRQVQHRPDDAKPDTSPLSLAFPCEATDHRHIPCPVVLDVVIAAQPPHLLIFLVNGSLTFFSVGFVSSGRLYPEYVVCHRVGFARPEHSLR